MASPQLISPIPPILNGPGAVKKLGQQAKGLGGSKAFVCTDAGLTKAGVTKKITDILEKAELEVAVFDGVEANPSVDVVEAGAKKLREFGASVVITLGGGSTMDAGKAMVCLSAEEPDAKMVDYCISPELKDSSEKIKMSSFVPKKIPSGNIPPIIAVPTTSGTASETNMYAIITNKDRKLLFANPRAEAKLVILDAELVVPVPAYPTATCGMDVLTHAIEAFTSNNTNAYSDSVALGAIKLVAEYLPLVMKDLSNVEYRAKMHLASHMAGIAFKMAGLGLVHAMGHPLSAIYHQAHGQTLATMLPHVMRYNLGACKEKYAQVAMAFGVHHPLKSVEENAHRAIDAVARLSIQVGTARSIESFGGKEADIPTLIKQTLTDGVIMATPVYPSAKDVETLFRAGWKDESLYPTVPTSKL